MKRIGFIVNPIAGMGGRVGLKGTDGNDILEKAIALGAKPIAPERAKTFLNNIKPLSSYFELVTYSKVMGEYEVLESGLNSTVVGEVGDKTTAEDTVRAARIMFDLGLDLIIFCGGDGTARDICRAVGLNIPVLGIPSGVKMYSAVFAYSVDDAVKLFRDFVIHGLPLKMAEVMDVDEESFRSDKLLIKLYGYLMVPYKPIYVQGVKSPTMSFDSELDNQRAIAKYILEVMESDALYILGPGSTVKAITDLLGLEKTLLGVDLMMNFKIVARDVCESDILGFLDRVDIRKAYIIVSPIGGQGFIFGRGNQQISDSVIRRVGLDNVIIVATWSKILNLDSLRVDVGDPELNEMFKGYRRVVVDYREEKMVKVV